MVEPAEVLQAEVLQAEVLQAEQVYNINGIVAIRRLLVWIRRTQ